MGSVFQRVLCGKDTIEEAVFNALAHFNDGTSSVLKLFDKLGFEGQYTAEHSMKKDIQKIANSRVKSAERTQKRRKALRAIKKGFQDKAEAREGDMYTPGVIRRVLVRTVFFFICVWWFFFIFRKSSFFAVPSAS